MGEDTFNGMQIFKDGVAVIKIGSDASEGVEDSEPYKEDSLTLETSGDHIRLTICSRDTAEIEVQTRNYEPCHFCGGGNDGVILLNKDKALQLANTILERLSDK